MKRTSFLLPFLFLGLSACSMLQRSANSGYYETSIPEARGTQEFYNDKKSYEIDETRQELGMRNSQALSDADRERIEDRMTLKRLESKLETQREKRQYYKLKGIMRSDRERIAFLRIPTIEARERFAQNRGLRVDENYSEAIVGLIESQDIAVGMSQKAVTESWGDPDVVEVAGDPVYGNERWKYSHYTSGNEGYQKEMRVVYFESGRVVGWESH